MKLASIVALLFLAFTPKAFAQDASLGVANFYPIEDASAKDGDIVSYTTKGYFLSKTPYDNLMMGVIVDTPAIAINLSATVSAKAKPVVATGTAYVNVSTANGPIKEGDPITSSETPGVGMKADKSGYVLGSALEEFSASDTTTVGKIAVSVNIHYVSMRKSRTQNATDVFKNMFSLSQVATYESPVTAFKYIVAALVILLSFALGFFSFGRLANTGIEALGRNPLAGKLIELGVIVNVSITIAIIASGFGIAYLLLII